MSLADVVAHHDPVATFYGGYDQIGIRWVRRQRVPWAGVAITLAAIVLIVFVAADVAAFESRPAVVTVTTVTWYAETIDLVSGPGFTMHSGQHVTLPFQCISICFPFTGASVNAPFQLVGFTHTPPPVQNVNVTVQAPSGAYSGPLTIVLTFTY